MSDQKTFEKLKPKGCAYLYVDKVRKRRSLAPVPGSADLCQVEMSSTMLQMINDLYRTGLWGESPQATTRRLIEAKLRELFPPNT